MATKCVIERFSESAATKHLNWLFYFGCGSKYLGWKYAVHEILEDGTTKLTEPPGARVWSVPSEPMERIRWNPVWLHLKGCPRGVCRGQGERFVPFVTVDMDRHYGQVLAQGHCQAVLKTGRILKRDYGYLKWLVEVNPKNGSTKFFGFTGKPIPIEYANRLGEQIHQSLIANGIGPREVFPYNSPQVFLPMRSGKTTIIDTGVLGQVERRRDNGKGQREKFTTYSAVGFVEWLRRGRSFDDATLERVLISACLQLADEPALSPKVATVLSGSTKKPIKAVSTPANVRDEPDSFIRQREALMEFCRRNRRVVSVEEGLEFIRANTLFTGSWEENHAKRKMRVGQILSFIAQTFDPSLCTGVRHEINFGKFDRWAKRHCPEGWRAAPRKVVDPFGVIHERCRTRTVADWRFVSVFLSITEYIVCEEKNADESVPSARAESLWTLLFEQGVVAIPFCHRKWKIVRDHLERLGVLKIDHHYHRGQAMRWWAGSCFPGHGDWKKPKVRGLLEAVPLIEFLGKIRARETITHNSLLQQAIQDWPGCGPFWGAGRDPPPTHHPPTDNQTTKMLRRGRGRLNSMEIPWLIGAGIG